ncbi:unnamed protein product [Amoebophrya sp. A25]|nr:unnamed protein product [Amoebophrya sp. A25]|eukprot:GSA25T00002260001.1
MTMVAPKFVSGRRIGVLFHPPRCLSVRLGNPIIVSVSRSDRTSRNTHPRNFSSAGSAATSTCKVNRNISTDSYLDKIKKIQQGSTFANGHSISPHQNPFEQVVTSNFYRQGSVSSSIVSGASCCTTSTSGAPSVGTNCSVVPCETGHAHGDHADNQLENSSFTSEGVLDINSSHTPASFLYPAFSSGATRNTAIKLDYVPPPEVTMPTLYWGYYGENSILVTGDTIQVKGTLKELGGNWNMKEKGWMMQKSKWDGIQKKLEEMCIVKQLDESGEPVPKRQKTEDKSSNPLTAGPSADDKFIDLGQSKRVALTIYQGRKMINFREFYEDKASGEMKPGAKGITLTADNYKKLSDKYEQMEEAIGAQEDAWFEIEGGIQTKRYFTLSSYKGKWYVAVREYWKPELEDDFKPGRKGLTISVDQYRKISENHETILSWLS